MSSDRPEYLKAPRWWLENLAMKPPEPYCADCGEHHRKFFSFICASCGSDGCINTSSRKEEPLELLFGGPLNCLTCSGDTTETDHGAP